MNSTVKNLIVGLLLVTIAVVSRVILHLPNFAAIAAVGLFAGFYFRGKVAFLIPLVAVLISDLFVGFYDLGTMIFVYAAWMVPVFIGRSKMSFTSSPLLNNILTIGSQAILASVSFFLISNLGVWLFSGMYPINFAGTIECYTLAIPFFRFTILGDLLFSAVIFGSFHLVGFLSTNKKEVEPVYLRK